MSLQRRLLLVVLIGAPVVWLIALAIGLLGARQEINELFDTQQVRFARQVAALLPSHPGGSATTPPSARPALPLPASAASGAAELGDLSVSAWDARGRILFEDGIAGPHLPYLPEVSGFQELRHPRGPWRVYYQQVPAVGATVAVGQWVGERNELIRDLMLGQVGPWLLMLALLLPVLYVGVRRTMAPVKALARHIEGRRSDDRRPLPVDSLPEELKPLVTALNRMFRRVAGVLEQERRFTADAAHELRTPIAAIRSQWEVAAASPDAAQRARASALMLTGIERSSRVVSQLLALSRVDAMRSPAFEERIDWCRVVGDALSEVLDLAEQRGTTVEVVWTADASDTLPMLASPELITAALRNLLDNAVRYSPPSSSVTVVCRTDAVIVVNEGAGVAEELIPRLKERFFRAGGPETAGSGLGLSIVDRIAALHGLALRLANRPDGGGFRATLCRARPSS